MVVAATVLVRNVIIFSLMVKVQSLRNRSNIILGSLATTDLLVGVLVAPMHILQFFVIHLVKIAPLTVHADSCLCRYRQKPTIWQDDEPLVLSSPLASYHIAPAVSISSVWSDYYIANYDDEIDKLDNISTVKNLDE